MVRDFSGLIKPLNHSFMKFYKLWKVVNIEVKMALDNILAPQFLINNIGVISLIIAGFLLVIFDDFTNRTAFRFADNVKASTESALREYGTKRKSKFMEFVGKFLAEAMATAIILLYCYFATTVLANYVFNPILLSLRNIILPVLLGVFLVISYIINEKSVREKLMRA